MDQEQYKPHTYLEENNELKKEDEPRECSVVFSRPDDFLEAEPRETALLLKAIRAREEQQWRMRAALEEQSRQLRARLAPFGAGESTSPAVGPQRKSGNRSCSPSVSPQRQSVVTLEEFINFVTQMKELVSDAQRADLAALYALQDHMEFQNRGLTQRIAGLEAQLIAMQRQEDFGHGRNGSLSFSTARLSIQKMEDKPVLNYLISEIRNVEDVSAETTEHVCQLNSALERLQVSFSLLRRDLNAIETKVVDLEAIPSVFSRHATTMDERYMGFTRQVREEVAQQEQHLHQSVSMLKEYIKGAEDKLRFKTDPVIKSEEQDTFNSKGKNFKVDGELHKCVSSLLEVKALELKVYLEEFINAKIEEFNAHSLPESMEQKKNIEKETAVTSCCINDAAEVMPATNLTSLNCDADANLADICAVTNNCDSQDVNLDKLHINIQNRAPDDATAVSEGASTVANCDQLLSVNSGVLSLKEVVERLGELEGRVQKMEGQLGSFFATLPDECAKKKQTENSNVPETKGIFVNKFNFKHDGDNFDARAECGGQLPEHVRSQSSKISPRSLHPGTPPLPPTFSFSSPLPSFPFPPASSSSTAKACHAASENNVSDARRIDRCSSAPFLPCTKPRFSSYFLSLLAEERQKHKGQQRREPLPSPPQVFAQFKAPPLSVKPQELSKSIAEIRERKRQKKEAITKIIASLRDIQRCFAELSKREPTAKRKSLRKCNKECLSNNMRESSVDILESIASRKEALCVKEKQLLEFRNSLWLEIAQLEEEERVLLSS